MRGWSNAVPGILTTGILTVAGVVDIRATELRQLRKVSENASLWKKKKRHAGRGDAFG